MVKILTFLRDDGNCQFTILVDVLGVDWPARPKRFDVVYHLLSMKLNQRIRIKVQTDEETPVPSVTPVFSSAGWFEREVWDMYGVMFSGHPDLRRILSDYRSEEHTSELQSLMRTSYAVFCLQKKKNNHTHKTTAQA